MEFQVKEKCTIVSLEAALFSIFHFEGSKYKITVLPTDASVFSAILRNLEKCINIYFYLLTLETNFYKQIIVKL